MQIKMKLASESHVPRFRAGVGTWRSGYMIPIRLPWRHRARPSATLHEIPVCPEEQTCLHDATHPHAVRQGTGPRDGGSVRASSGGFILSEAAFQAELKISRARLFFREIPARLPS
jgi:hypothetical protein